MIETKEAVRIALEYMRDLYEQEQTPHLTLEEVELSKDQQFWLVTLSFSKPSARSPIEAMTSQHGALTYKVLQVHSETGFVHSMKTRQV